MSLTEVLLQWFFGDLHTKLDTLIEQQETMMATIQDLVIEVGELRTVEASAIALLDGLKVKLDEAIASGDPAALEALRAELDTSTADLAAAVTRNTPAEPTP